MTDNIYGDGSWGSWPTTEAGAQDIGVRFVPDFLSAYNPLQASLLGGKEPPMRAKIRAVKLQYEMETNGAIEDGQNVIATIEGKRVLIGRMGWKVLG